MAPIAFWVGKILFYETSEDAPSPDYVKYWLRNFAAQGILKVLNGILIARADPGDDEDYLDVLAEEGLSQIPVLSGLNFGHTKPISTLPYGVKAKINCGSARLEILEAPTVSRNS